MINTSVVIAVLASVLTLVRAASQSQETQYQYFIFTPKCYQSLLLNNDLTDMECIKQAFSKLMGYVLVIGGGIVKVPQIIRILVDKSVFGISYSSILLQSATNWIVIIYSWHSSIPFSIYGENVFILFQNLIIVFLFIIFGHKLPRKDKGTATTFYGVSFFLVVFMMYFTQNPNAWPQAIIGHIMYCQMALFSSARLAQIFHIFKFKSTGSLSLITCFLNFLGNLGRLFTIFVQINDVLFAASVVLATVLNFTILVQFSIYWNNKGSAPQENKKAHKQL